MYINDLLEKNSLTKICVPLTGKNYQDLELEAINAYNSRADLVELRADFFEDIDDIYATFSLVSDLKEILNEMPIIFTLRTKNEGGNKIIIKEDYIFLIENMIKSKLISIIDIEVLTADDKCEYLINLAKQFNVLTILSCHNFSITPPISEIEEILSKMHELGCDIPKIAVTPNDKLDVLNLMTAVINFKEKNNSPVIAISMRDLGNITRVACNFLETCLTFAVTSNSSAPGQLDVDTVYYIINSLASN